MAPEIRIFSIDDYRAAMDLWRSTEGVGLSDADSLEGISRFLARNPSLSFVAVDGARVVATILCGHDGRRGLVHHLVVSPPYRGKGLGRALVRRALAGLRKEGIQKCHLLVFRDNKDGHAFWAAMGAEERVMLATFSIETPGDINEYFGKL